MWPKVKALRWLYSNQKHLYLQNFSICKHQGNPVIFQIESTFLRLSHLCFVPRAWVGTCFDSISRLLSVCPSSYCTPHTAQLPKSFSIYVLGFPSKPLYGLEQYLRAILGPFFSQQLIMWQGWKNFALTKTCMTHSQMLGKFEYTRGPIFKVVLEC